MTMTLLEAILSIEGINPDPNQWIWVLPQKSGKITPECPAVWISGEYPGPDGYSKFGNAKQIDWDLTDYPLGFDEQTREAVTNFILDSLEC